MVVEYAVMRFFSEFPSFEESLVRCCYRALLGREPEGAVLAAQRAKRLPRAQEKAVMAILERFTSSDEYNHRVRAAASMAYDGSLFPVHRLIEGGRTDVQDNIRKRCMVSYLGDGVALCRVLGRFHMFIDTSDVGFATHVMHSGAWEMPLTEFMVKTVKPGMRVIDVGAIRCRAGLTPTDNRNYQSGVLRFKCGQISSRIPEAAS